MAAWKNSPFLNNLNAARQRTNYICRLPLTSPSLHQAVLEPNESVGGINGALSD